MTLTRTSFRLVRVAIDRVAQLNIVLSKIPPEGLHLSLPELLTLPVLFNRFFQFRELGAHAEDFVRHNLEMEILKILKCIHNCFKLVLYQPVKEESWLPLSFMKLFELRRSVIPAIFAKAIPEETFAV